MVNRMGYYDDYLEHHGILGQKWGVRRFESANGTLTAAGKKRYTTDGNGNYKKVKKTTSADVETSKKKTSNEEETEEKKKGLSDKQKKALIIGAAAVGTAVAAYGGYKLYQLNKQATEGISKDFHEKAVANAVASNKLKVAGYDMYDQSFKLARNTGSDESNKLMDLGKSYMNQASLHKDLADQYDFRVNAKNYSIKEKYNYLKKGKTEDSALSKLTRSQINDEQAKRGSIASGLSKEVKKIADTSPAKAIGLNPKNTATNKLASEASSLAKSVKAEGPKSFSKPAQNSSAAKQAMTNQKLSATVTSFNAGKKAVSNATKIHGQTKFSQASKANDDYVSQMLKKNKSLSSYSMDDLKKLDLY